MIWGFGTVLMALWATTQCYKEIDSFLLGELGAEEGYFSRLTLDANDELNHFKHFNRTRTPGSEGSQYIQSYIISHFEQLNSKSEENAELWELETDSFIEKDYNFTNIVASKKPKHAENERYIVFAAHFDTLLKPEGFLGAIDSAVSCSLLLDLAESINEKMDQVINDYSYDLNVGIKFVFFDGEEALHQWTAEDSIYGAKHLYSKWEQEDKIKQIKFMVLLDLLGAKDSNYVPSYFENTQEIYNLLSDAETRLITAYPTVFTSYSKKYFHPPTDAFIKEFNGYMEDDHIPFLKNGVPIVHLIPKKFPRIWHTKKDDFLHISLVAVNRWKLILHCFIIEYLELE